MPSSTPQCLACKSSHGYPLAYWAEMPLSVLGLPRSATEAEAMPRYVMDLRRCASCGHVWHTEFDYAKIPYRTGSNLVFNKAHFWRAYQDELAAEWLERFDLRGKTVLEIGCGEGLFLERFLEAGARCVAFEPGPDADKARAKGIETYREYFTASRLADERIRPDAIICRHVIEHLEDPLDFVEDISLGCQRLGIQPWFLAEVPRVDKALEQHRMNDWLYEHVSNFTTNSFKVMFERAGYEIASVEPRHSGEVVTLAARPRQGTLAQEIRASAEAYRASVASQTEHVHGTLAMWKAEGRQVAVWGGTGKGAALINMFGITPELVATVIDSDPLKVGGYVPGTGQRIEGPEFLDAHPVDAILIATQWRARDIEYEIRQLRQLETPLYVYHRGRIVPLTDDLSL